MYKKEGKPTVPSRRVKAVTIRSPSEEEEEQGEGAECYSGSDMDDLDETDGPPGPLVNRRAVRWRTKSTAGGHFVETKRARLLNSIRKRDVQGVKVHLQEITRSATGADPTRVEDEFAVSVLEHAVRSGSLDVLNELLAVCETPEERGNAIDRAMLFAIKNDDIHMCRHIVKLHKAEGRCKNETNGDVTSKDRPSSEDSEAEIPLDAKVVLRLNERKWSQPRTLSTLSVIDDSEFSQEMTPIVMAAQLERTEIIRLLIDECCPDIHPLTEIPTSGHAKENCYVCNEQANFVGRQTVEECKKAIEVYKALSSPAYIFQAGVEDPILEAFVISDIMERRKIVDPAFVEEYDVIAWQCKKLATDLLGLCRTGEEVVALLSYDGGIKQIHTKYHTARYPRLMVATFYNQKEFIAHPNCQQVLQNEWYRGLPNWVCQQNQHVLRTLVYVLLITLGMPFILLLYMFRLPFVDRFVRPPVSKFLFDIITYIAFLGLLFTNSAQENTHIRGARPSALEIAIMVWLAGYTVRFVRVVLRRRCFLVQSYDQSRSAFYQFISIVLFWTYFIIKLALFGVGEIKGDVEEEDRHLWNWYDPFLWCEIFYAIACAISVGNLYTFFKASSTLGPLQISLKSMLFDVFRFLILFIVVLSAFSIALTTLYTGYTGSKRRNRQGEPGGFSNLQDTYKTLFWDLFGYGDPSDVEIRLLQVNGTPGEQLKDVGHRLTEWMGFGLYGFYHMFVIIVLLNMLIAMMANSYNVVVKNSITEWRFARTRLILSYMNELGVLVPPFNLLPIRFLLGLCVKKTQSCCKKGIDPSTFFPKTYKSVMESVSKRYWRQREEMIRRIGREDSLNQRPNKRASNA